MKATNEAKPSPHDEGPLFIWHRLRARADDRSEPVKKTNTTTWQGQEQQRRTSEPSRKSTAKTPFRRISRDVIATSHHEAGIFDLDEPPRDC